MALIELELGRPNFEAMALLALSASPIPGPTFTAIGADRLLASMKWSSATLVSSVPGSVSGPGAVLTKSSVEIRHVSVDELLADPNATGSTVTGTAWVHWTLTLAGLQGRLIRLEAAQSQVWQQGLMICERRFRPPLAVMKSAMLAGPKSITLRYATVNSDDLLVPAANRLDEADGSWHLHVSSGVFVDEMTTLFSKILTPPPSGMEIEDALNVTWTSVGGGGGGWGVRAQVGLEKIDACPALIEDVDVSVDVTTTLQLVPDPGKETLGQRLRVEGDASDWDVFRCWAGSGGLGSFVLISLGTGLVGIGAAVGSLALIGGIVQDGIAKEIAKLDAGPLKLVESDDSSRTFAGSRALPGRGIGSINSASTGPEGLSVRGSLPPIIPVTHQASFHPNSDPVDGAWAGDYVCGAGGLGGGWQQRFCWNPILISDRAVILAGLVDKTYAWVPVTVFPTSMVTPAPGWHIDHDDPVSDQVVTVTGDEWLAGGGEGFLILHTSAGIRRYRMDVPAAPPSPSPVIIAQHAAKCLKWTEVFLDPQQEIK
ncbi:hypothetical protein AAHZ94_05240 [Streptomyces sp. HSW2009]|uniref:hypothetical protein n=1 Tax=Streptomyces sp. HSW2009 TaxID=3142890 RepID=UPI0032EED1A8